MSQENASITSQLNQTAEITADSLDSIQAQERRQFIRRAARWNVIINTRQGRWGVFEADSKHPDAFTYEDTNFLYGFANILGIALSNTDRDKAASDR